MDMRKRLFGVVIAVCGLVVLGTSQASAGAAWMEYVYPDLGIAKEFPAPPRRSQIVYAAPEGSSDEARVAGEGRRGTLLETTVDNIVYRMTVVDFSDRLADSANIFSECLYLAEQAGEEVDNVHMGVGGGDTEVYGRQATVDLSNNRGRMLTSCYFYMGKLYRIEAHVLPAHGNPTDPRADRFTSTVRFELN
jgi:hypothetical protein